MDDADREERAYTAALEELAASEQPPVELDPYRARLRAAGVVEVEGVLDVEVVRLTSLGTRIRATADEARQSSSEIAVRARRFADTSRSNGRRARRRYATRSTSSSPRCSSSTS